ncbi:hypothetical protein SNEBB_004773 [Seison nebaliae]|nr:hypothetical protein SNEBB_004773 [Seison nebaliae]
MEVDEKFNILVVIAATISTMITDGISYSYGVLLIVFKDYFNTSTTILTLVGSITVSVYLGSGPVVAILIRKFKTWKTCFLGGLLLCTGTILTLFCTNVPMLIVTQIICGLGIAFSNLTALIMVGLCFEKYRSLTTGLVTAGSGLGCSLFGPLMEYFIKDFGWKGAQLLIAGIALNLCVVGIVFKLFTELEEKPIDKKQEIEEYDEIDFDDGYVKNNGTTNFSHIPMAAIADDDISTMNSRHFTFQMSMSHPNIKEAIKDEGVKFLGYSDSNLRRMDSDKVSFVDSFSVYRSGWNLADLDDGESKDTNCWMMLHKLLDMGLFKNGGFRRVWFSHLFSFFGFYTPYFLIIKYAVDHNISDNNAALLLLWIGVTNIAGRIISGFLCNIFRGKTAIINGIGLLIAGIATCCLPLSANYIWLCCYSFLFGFFSAFHVTLCTVLLVESVGVNRLTNSFGLVCLARGITVLIGPYVTGSISDWIGREYFTFIISGIFLTIGGVIIMLPKIQLHRSK